MKYNLNYNKMFNRHEHANKSGHRLLWNEVKFTNRDSHRYTRKVEEVIHTMLNPDDINRDRESKFLKHGYQRSRDTTGNGTTANCRRNNLKSDLSGNQNSPERLVSKSH